MAHLLSDILHRLSDIPSTIHLREPAKNLFVFTDSIQWQYAEAAKPRIRNVLFTEEFMECLTVEYFETIFSQYTKKLTNQIFQRVGGRCLPVILNGKLADAVHDTMSSQNVITEAYARSIGLVINREPGKRQFFTNAIGEVSESVGETNILVAFPDKPTQKWKCTFAVVKECPTSLVLGNQFLTKTETLTKFQHRLKKVPVRFNKFWRLMWLDEPRQKLQCLVESKPVLASADTGADIDLISLAYAKSQEWKVSRLPKDVGYVMLSNQRTVKVDGYVEKWFTVGEEVSLKRFYVLDGLACDLLLGDETIEELDLFNRHESLFVDIEELTSMANFHMIQWIDRINEMDSWADGKLAECNQAQSTPMGMNGTLQADPQPGIWNRFTSKLGFRTKMPPTDDSKDMQIALRRKLEELDQIEKFRRKLATTKMAKMQDRDLQEEMDRDEERRLRYLQVRKKLLLLMKDLGK